MVKQERQDRGGRHQHAAGEHRRGPDVLRAERGIADVHDADDRQHERERAEQQDDLQPPEAADAAPRVETRTSHGINISERRQHEGRTTRAPASGRSRRASAAAARRSGCAPASTIAPASSLGEHARRLDISSVRNSVSVTGISGTDVSERRLRRSRRSPLDGDRSGPTAAIRRTRTPGCAGWRRDSSPRTCASVASATRRLRLWRRLDVALR